ncbi:Xaa-Pro dipeptidyl-peptidase-like domain-containing protein [Deinococcus deserti]|uniref:Xaa-Pro dipeptidyl-peptidase-like domain-containing protein n=2 Tax=Deinococcus TaxID=1298 RepID=C1D1U1_DEIDV|nr:Hypothetical protein Deide_09370 [Deinococcus deserti VCD115]
MAEPARMFAEAGWHALSLSSRGWRGSGGCDDYGRSGARDTRLALEWLSSQPRGPVVMLGFSMGGLIALLTAATQDTCASHVVAVSAPTDLRRVYQSSALNALRRYYDAVLTAKQWHEGSPLTHARALNVPGLLAVGTEDRVCPPEEGRSFAAASGSRLLEIDGMAHEPREQEWATIVQETLTWTRMP